MELQEFKAKLQMLPLVPCNLRMRRSITLQLLSTNCFVNLGQLNSYGPCRHTAWTTMYFCRWRVLKGSNVEFVKTINFGMEIFFTSPQTINIAYFTSYGQENLINVPCRTLEFLSWSPQLYDDIQFTCLGHAHCYLVGSWKQQGSRPTRLSVLN